MSQRKLGKNQFAVLKALNKLPANQVPHQIYEEMRSQGICMAKTIFSQTLGSLTGQGYIKRKGVAPAFYYTKTKTGEQVLESALELERAIAIIKAKGGQREDKIPF